MMIGLNLLIQGANNKHSFEIKNAKRNDNSLDTSYLIDPYRAGLWHSTGLCGLYRVVLTNVSSALLRREPMRTTVGVTARPAQP
jgi:hypothetical protein